MRVPPDRVRVVGEADVSPQGDYVVYWMTAFRRARWNFALDHAIDRAREMGKPLVVLEALRVDYPWASDRFHAFITDGMADNAKAFAGSGVRYYPYVEPEPGAGKGLLREIASRACLIVADDYPAFFLPQALAAASRLPIRVEAVDSNGLLPMRVADRPFPTAYSFRRFLQQQLPQRLDTFPDEDPLRGAKPPAASEPPVAVERRWPAAEAGLLRRSTSLAAALPIDHDIGPCALGGAAAAQTALDGFLRGGLSRYADDRNHPDLNITSGLSPFLHFGHISAHEVFMRVADRERWSPGRLAPRADGKRSGWWGMSPSAEQFLDQLVTWRELGFNMCAQRDDYDRYESLPEWALTTLAQHERDPREHIYNLEDFERARTHNPLWNAAQTQLVWEGRIHNYLRMLWGKKILDWTRSPREALDVMIELNNKYALDGRDPNSYSGIFWVLGRYDRAWGPERPVFGKVRYMSSRNTARKVRASEYVLQYATSGERKP